MTNERKLRTSNDTYCLNSDFVNFELSHATLNPSHLLDVVESLLHDMAKDIREHYDDGDFIHVQRSTHHGLYYSDIVDLHDRIVKVISLSNSWKETTADFERIDEHRISYDMEHNKIEFGQEVDELLINTWNSVAEELTFIAPLNCTFGTTEADGSRFGFWSNEPRELQRTEKVIRENIDSEPETLVEAYELSIKKWKSLRTLLEHDYSFLADVKGLAANVCAVCKYHERFHSARCNHCDVNCVDEDGFTGPMGRLQRAGGPRSALKAINEMLGLLRELKNLEEEGE